MQQLPVVVLAKMVTEAQAIMDDLPAKAKK